MAFKAAGPAAAFASGRATSHNAASSFNAAAAAGLAQGAPQHRPRAAPGLSSWSTQPAAQRAETSAGGNGRRAMRVCVREAVMTVQSISSLELDDPNPVLAYEMLQGPLVRWVRPGAGVTPPTAVLVHGILGSRRNMQSFARMLLEGYPSWQVLLVDLRCHGESVGLADAPAGPHTVHTAASDIITLLRNLKLFPRTLIGHSFGGKVVMSMTQQFGMVLPRPVQVWVLDALPGEVRAGNGAGGVGDHPAQLIDFLRSMPLPIQSRSDAVAQLTAAGFSPAIASWAATNLRPISSRPGSSTSLTWTFDLEGIRDMYKSYESTDMFPLLESPPQGLKLDFVKAEHSNFRWGGEDEARIAANGHRVHLLRNSGHWVHADNPVGLFDILAPTFGEVALQQKRQPAPGRG